MVPVPYQASPARQDTPEVASESVDLHVHAGKLPGGQGNEAIRTEQRIVEAPRIVGGEGRRRLEQRAQLLNGIGHAVGGPAQHPAGWVRRLVRIGLRSQRGQDVLQLVVPRPEVVVPPLPHKPRHVIGGEIPSLKGR